MARLAATTATLRELFALSGNRCAFPGCEHPLVNEHGRFIAELCHIEGVKGERYNPAQSEEEKRSAGNLILLCHRHHVETDDVTTYTSTRLKEIKIAHETKYKPQSYQLPLNTAEKILDEVNKKLDGLFIVTTRTEQKVDLIANQIKALSDKIANPVIDEEKYYIEQLDFIKELKKEQKHQTAIKLLLEYKEKNWYKISAETKFKLIATIAFTYFDLHDKKAASETILELKNVAFENEESLSLLSIANALLKQKDEFEYYFKKTKERNPENVNAWIAYITLYGEEPEFTEDNIPSKILNNPEIIFNLGETYYNGGQRKKGLDYFNRSLSIQNISNEKQADTKSIIASRLLADLADPFKYLNSYNDDEKEALSLAIKLFTESWEVIRNTELEKSRFYVVMNRGVAYKLIRNRDKALSDFQKAYDVSPEFLPFKNLFVLYLEMGNLDQAEELLSSWELKTDLLADELSDICHLKGRLLFLQNNVQGSIRELEKNMLEGNPNQLNTLCTIISFLLEKQLYEQAMPYCEQLKRHFPNEVISHVITASLAFAQNDFEKGLQNLDCAFTLVNEHTAPHEIYELASHYVNAGKFEKGAELFTKIADKKNANSLSRGLIYAQYQMGNISEALSLATDLLSRDPGSPFLAEVVINIFLEAKKIDQAAETIEKYLPLAPRHLRDFFLLKAAIIYHHKKEYGKAKSFLTQIEKPEKLPMNDAFNMAKLLVKCDENAQALLVAYNARNAFYQERTAHESYISTSLLVQQSQDELFPVCIERENVVYTKDKDGKEKIFFISDKSSLDSATTIGYDDPMAKKMIGKRLEEDFFIENRFGGALQLTVTAILNKYVFAFQQSMSLLETRFSGETDFVVFRYEPENPIESLTNTVKQIFAKGEEFRKQVLNLYRFRIAPIGVLASLSKRNIVEQWFNLITSNEVFLYAYSFNELPILAEAFNTKRPLIIDITSLLTLFFVYPEHDLFDSTTNTMVVAQATIDELEGFLGQLDSYRQDGRLSVGFQDGAVIGSYIANEDIQHHREIIRKIIEWCRLKAEVRSPETLLELNRQERVKSSELISPAFFDTVLLAKEMQGYIVSDDDSFKNLAISQYSISSFSTFQWGINLLANGKISSELFERMTNQLILANYIYIPVGNDTLWTTFENAGFQIRKPFTVAVEGLKILNPIFAAFHCVRFAKRLYLNSGLSVVREQILIFILANLATQNSFTEIRKNILLRIAIEFKYIPSFGDNFIQILSNF